MLGINPGGNRDNTGSRAKPNQTNKIMEMKSLVEIVKGNMKEIAQTVGKNV